MIKTILIGIDIHVKNLVCFIGINKEQPVKKIFTNDYLGHTKLISYIKELKSSQLATDIMIGYEASGMGYLLYDRLIDEGYNCVVLAPTEMLRSATGYKKKTDTKDANYIYETIRGHMLAGNKLHDIWVPDKALRYDRELVRTWFDVSQKITRVKIQVQTLLRKYGLKRPEKISSWTRAFLKWLDIEKSQQSKGFKISLESLQRQLQFLECENKIIEKEVDILSQKDRYRVICEKLMEIKGVGLKTAMTFLTEIGDVRRFSNRRQIGAYIGLVPSVSESGENDDRKGRITRNGPYRVRSILNQAIWAHLRYYGEEKLLYDKIVTKNPKRKKKAVVACMRRLAIKMWHVAYDATNIESQKLIA